VSSEESPLALLRTRAIAPAPVPATQTGAAVCAPVAIEARHTRVLLAPACRRRTLARGLQAPIRTRRAALTRALRTPVTRRATHALAGFEARIRRTVSVTCMLAALTIEALPAQLALVSTYAGCLIAAIHTSAFLQTLHPIEAQLAARRADVPATI
jgi:hypothetical protein